MYNFLMVLHVLIVITLIGAILVQRGRSGGLVEALGGVESIFGTKTHSVMVRITVGLAIAFFTTSLSLAYLSKQRGKSVMERMGSDTSVVAGANATGVTMPGAATLPDQGSIPVNKPADANK